MQSVSIDPLKATFQLSSAGSLNLGLPQNGVLGNVLTLFQTSPGLQYKCFESTVRKGEIARNEQFLLFTQCFLPI